ncbi:MAG TPA: hypothetical protein VH482_17650, partial [Thermomicrobiales bacterium]
MTATTTANLAPAFNRLREITDLPADWDFDGAIPPSPAAIRKAQWILENIASRFLSAGGSAEPWLVGPRADGGILMEWRGPGGAVEVHVEPDASLGYLWDGEGTPQPGTEKADGV